MWNTFKVNNRDTSGVTIVNFEHISHLALVCILLLWTCNCRLGYQSILEPAIPMQHLKRAHIYLLRGGFYEECGIFYLSEIFFNPDLSSSQLGNIPNYLSYFHCLFTFLFSFKFELLIGIYTAWFYKINFFTFSRNNNKSMPRLN